MRKIPLSDNATKCRCDNISKDLLKQLVIKLKKSPAYGLQLDETTDILHATLDAVSYSGGSIVFFRFH